MKSLLLLFLILLPPVHSMAETLIIGHRGAPGYRPEHTLEGYQLAIDKGADMIEPDLVATKDGVLIARHENEISGTTNVAQVFPSRKKTKTVDGQTIIGWFTEDFTLAEIKKLRANERLAFRDQSFNGKFEIPTFQEIIALVKKSKRPVGIVPELKHRTYFKNLGLDLVPLFAKAIQGAGLNQADAKVIVQSAEPGALKELKAMGIKIPALFLISNPFERPADAGPKDRTYGDWAKPDALKEVRTFAEAIGPAKELMILPNGKSTGIFENAKKAGLQVIPWTFREEQQFILPAANNDAKAEYQIFYKMGVDALFSDFADKAVAARTDFMSKKK